MRLSLRFITFLLAFVALIMVGLVIYFLSLFAGTSINELFSLSLSSDVLQSEIQRIIYIQGIVIVLSFLIILGVLLATTDAILIKPLKELSQGIAALKGDMSTDLSHLSGSAPLEVSVIFDAVTGMIERVRAAHSRDMEMSRTKSDFISTAAHQLRTPLTGIRWAMEALQKEESLSPDKKQVIRDAAEKSKELIEVVRTLLDVSAIESGKYKYKFVAVDMLALARGVISEFEVFARERNVLVSVTAPEDMPYVRADEERIRWVIVNLIENAIRYTPAQGAVTVSFEPVGDRVFIYVSDTGIGIPPEDRVNIFERFYRGKNASVKENEGNGLGLYIARNVIRDHQGELSFKENSQGIGTMFFFSLPIAVNSSSGV